MLNKTKSASVTIVTRLAVLVAFLQHLQAMGNNVLYATENASGMNTRFDFNENDFPELQQNLAACNMTIYDRPVTPNATYVDESTIACHSRTNPLKPAIELFVQAGQNLTSSFVECFGSRIDGMCEDFYTRHPYTQPVPPYQHGGGGNYDPGLSGLAIFGIVVGGIVFVSIFAGIIACCCSKGSNSALSSRTVPYDSSSDSNYSSYSRRSGSSYNYNSNYGSSYGTMWGPTSQPEPDYTGYSSHSDSVPVDTSSSDTHHHSSDVSHTWTHHSDPAPVETSSSDTHHHSSGVSHTWTHH